MSSRFDVWLQCQPILLSLPNIFSDYQSNEVVKILLEYWDKLLCDSKTKIENLNRQLDPKLCEPKYLKFLGKLHGFDDGYDILDFFDIDDQRKLISNSVDFIWRYKGSRIVLDFVLDCLNVCYGLYKGTDDFLADISCTDENLGEELELTNYFIIPFEYDIDGNEYLKLKKIIDLFTPVYTSNSISYPEFCADISTADMVLFEPAQTVDCNI